MRISHRGMLGRGTRNYLLNGCIGCWWTTQGILTGYSFSQVYGDLAVNQDTRIANSSRCHCLPDKFSLTWDCLRLWTRRLNISFCTFKSEVKTQALKVPNSKHAANRLEWTLTLNAVWNDVGNCFEALEKLQRPWSPIQNPQGKPHWKVHWFASSGPKAVEFTIVINQWKAKSTGEVKTGFSHLFTTVPAVSTDLENRASMSCMWTSVELPLEQKHGYCTYNIFCWIQSRQK